MNPIHILHLRWLVGQRQVSKVVMAEEFIQLTEALIIPGEAHVQQFIIPAELYPGNGLHPLVGTHLDELHNPRGVVDIGQCQGLYPAAHGFINQLFNRKSSVAE